MGVGWGGAAPRRDLGRGAARRAGALGNGVAIVCNQILVQRGAPDRYRGRALATIMSSNYAMLGLAMAAAGSPSRCAARAHVWLAAGGVYLFERRRDARDDRWLPVTPAGPCWTSSAPRRRASSSARRTSLEPETDSSRGCVAPEPRAGSFHRREASGPRRLASAGSRNGSSRESLERPPTSSRTRSVAIESRRAAVTAP